MKKYTFILHFLLTSILINSQSILIYDIVENSWDSITNLAFDTTIAAEYTDYYEGNFNTEIESLLTSPPLTNIYPGSQFSYKQIASEEYDLNKFPISTTTKIFQINDNSIGQLCSGSLISKKHVLTAAHCISLINTDSLRAFDSLYISPVYNLGSYNDNFCSSYVNKIYFFKDWNIGSEDIAILELNKPIGESTGWLSIGFDNNDTSLANGIFYKFSYPSITNLWIDPNEYNGDTLFYNYGLIDNLTDNSISINNTNGIEGESGSSIIKIVNKETYTTYGTLSLSNNLLHSRINDWKYFAIKSIIYEDSKIPENNSEIDFVLYPNPANKIVHIRNNDLKKIIQLKVYDGVGKLCFIESNSNSCLDFDISNLPDGTYFVSLETIDSITTKKLFKKSL